MKISTCKLSIHRRGLLALALVALLSIGAFPIRTSAQQAKPKNEIDRRVDAMLAKLTLEQKIDLIGGEDWMFIRATPEIGLPRLKMSDGPMGARTWGTTSGYAAGIGLAASWDPALAHRVGAAIGQDARARGVHFLLGPGVNIYRAPMNGRNFEYYGEDPYLAGRIAVHYIQGVQSRGVVATVKHYAGNNSEYDRHNVNSIIDERTLREIYLPVFEAAVKEGHVGAVMDSYNLLNGEHATQNTFLNTEVLKKDWGFRGILMSDWFATYDGVAAANSGLDLEMPSGQFMKRETLLPAVQSGKVSVATIDDKVRRVLRIALEYKWLDRDQTDLGIPLYSQQSRQTALESAEEAIVLLKNEGRLLPVDSHRVHTVAIIGPNAYPAVTSAGGSAIITAFAPVSSLTGLSDALGTGTKVLWSRGVKDVRDIFSGGGGIFGGRPTFWTDTEGKRPGLQQEEFSNDSFEGQPEHVGTVFNVNRWSGSRWSPSGKNSRGVRWTGYYIPKTSGPHRFIAVAGGRDGYRLYVDNNLVLDQPSSEGQTVKAADLDLKAGKPVAVRFEYLTQSEEIGASLGVVPVEEMLQPEVKKIAGMADVAIVSVGFNPETESEGYDRTYGLPPGQDELIKAVLAANPHTIVVVTAGGSVDTSQWLDKTPVLLQTWYEGQEAGRALAEVLLGKVSPSGKLPMSWERRLEDNPAYPNYYEAPGSKDANYKEGVFLGYRHYDRDSTKPLYPFGFGLSYTTFAFSNLTVTPTKAKAGAPITVSFEVRNTGQRSGAEVAQVYVGDPSATVPRPVKELKGFERVVLAPAASKRVTITLDRRSLAYWDVASKSWKVDPGKFVVYVGDSSANVPLKAEFTIQ
jgi:beta-glucosidase